MEPGRFDFEVGVPVDGEVRPTGRVQPGEQPGGRVAGTVYHGPYEGLHGAWGEFDAVLKAAGIATRDELLERYVAGPESERDPARYRTELNRMLG
jgi:effector-binding domain-containing protein